MTLTLHGHHIDGTPTDDEREEVVLVACGGPTVCSSCDFDVRWYKAFARAKRDKKNQHRIIPTEVSGLEAQTLRKIAAKLRARHHAPSMMMRVPKYQLAFTIYALADAMEGVAKDLELE